MVHWLLRGFHKFAHKKLLTLPCCLAPACQQLPPSARGWVEGHFMKNMTYVCDATNAKLFWGSILGLISVHPLTLFEVCQKQWIFSFVISNTVVEFVGVQINAIRFISVEADVQMFEIRILNDVSVARIDDILSYGFRQTVWTGPFCQPKNKKTGGGGGGWPPS